jgi:hypothetical protein
MTLHPADIVYLISELSGLGCAAKVADDDSRGVRGEVTKRRRPLEGTGVEDNVMAFTHQGTGGSAAESVGGAGDEDTGHEDNSSVGGVLPSGVSNLRRRSLLQSHGRAGERSSPDPGDPPACPGHWGYIMRLLARQITGIG